MENSLKLNFLEQDVISSTKDKNEYDRIKFHLPIEHRLRMYVQYLTKLFEYFFIS